MYLTKIGNGVYYLVQTDTTYSLKFNIYKKKSQTIQKNIISPQAL
jgi:hypothetical protein